MDIQPNFDQRRTQKSQDKPDYTIAGAGLKLTPEEIETKVRLTMRTEKLGRADAEKRVAEILQRAPGVLKEEQQNRQKAA